MHEILCKRIKAWGTEPLIHAGMWVIYIFGEIFSLALLTDTYSTAEHYIFFYLLNILLFYSYVWLLFKVSESSPIKYLYYISIAIGTLALYILLAGALTTLLKTVSHNGKVVGVLEKKFMISTAWRGFYFMLFATGFVLLKQNSKQKVKEMAKVLEIERLKSQLVSAEKDFLRSQINPHLLFNTLSFINHATKYNPGNARIALGLLSDIMDYALHCGDGDSVSLTEEIEQINNMIALNQLRFGDKLNLKFNINEKCLETSIAPLILLTLVENVFKHGDLLHNKISSVFEIDCQNNSIIFRTRNPIGKQAFFSSTKTGLRNIQSRLQNAYPSRHVFEFIIKDEVFETKLIISLLY
ncbi:sensor histidine kinase [Pedobacter agri]|uniref:sensor histidine kinase n=1 Tax=Pedobacter agri TaxID=454586 RepID=UPI0029311228|nr:histidine kinase [Pedobacter agri]